jgi:nucleoside-diphosphate-sugar epimerase
MKILLTGSNGFVGSHIAESLEKQGNHVACLVRHTSNCKWLDNLKIEKLVGDVTHPKTLQQAVKNVDAVIHSAGVLRARDPEFYYRVNRDGTRNLVEALLEYNPKVKKLIYISSQAAMGPSPEERQKRLDEAENPVSDYGWSKLAGEKELHALKGRVPYTILRPASVYGPRDKDIFIFFQLVNLGLRPRTAKRRLFQLVYVKDIVEAAARSLENKVSDYKTYFLADPMAYSWEEAAQTIAAATGRKTYPVPIPDFVFKTAAFFSEKVAGLSGKPAVLNRQKIDEFLQSFWLADSSPAASDLGMDFTKLENGAKMTYSWYKANNWL